MVRRSRLCAVLVAGLFLLASRSRAQVFVVDASNGPGTDFTSLEAAIQAAPRGATLRVRAGDYVVSSATPITRGLTVIGEGNVLVALESGVGPTTPADAVRLCNLWLHHRGRPEVTFTDVAGPLLLDRVSGANPTMVSSFAFSNCANLQLQGVRLPPPPWPHSSFAGQRISINACRGSLVNCEATSHSWFGAKALQAFGSHLVFDRCQWVGGYGLSWEISRGVSTSGGTGAYLDGCEAVFNRCSIRGGDGGWAYLWQYQHSGGDGLRAFGSDVRLEACGVSGGNGAAPISQAGGTVVVRPSAVPPYTTMTNDWLTLTGQPGSGSVLVVSTKTTFAPLAAYIGVLVVDDFVLVGPGMVQSGGQWAVPLSVPVHLQYQAVFAQHAVWDGADLWLTNPAAMVVR